MRMDGGDDNGGGVESDGGDGNGAGSDDDGGGVRMVLGVMKNH